LPFYVGQYVTPETLNAYNAWQLEEKVKSFLRIFLTKRPELYLVKNYFQIKVILRILYLEKGKSNHLLLVAFLCILGG
jgi:hypothetical protein